MLKDEMLEKVKNAGEPTYRFQPGDLVRHGGWAKSVILKDLYGDGTVYSVEDTAYRKDGTEVNCHTVAWYNVRPLTEGKSNFSRNEDIRLSYSNVTVHSLLSYHLHFGVNFEPVYQREYVWTDEDRERLLDSIFMGADIGRFVLKYLEGDDFDYEIIDGKQRFLTLLSYFENRFPYRGVYFNDLSAKDRRRFMDATTAIAMVRNPNFSLKDTLRVFLMMNRGGRPVSEEILKNAEKLLQEENARE